MKRIFLAAVLAATATVVFAADLVIQNDSLWDIHRIYISSTDTESWGEDQLDDDVLESGQSLRLTGVACGKYDVRLIDEDGDACELRNVKLCGDEKWVIENADLLACQSNTD